MNDPNDPKIDTTVAHAQTATQHTAETAAQAACNQRQTRNPRPVGGGGGGEQQGNEAEQQQSHGGQRQGCQRRILRCAGMQGLKNDILAGGREPCRVHIAIKIRCRQVAGMQVARSFKNEKGPLYFLVEPINTECRITARRRRKAKVSIRNRHNRHQGMYTANEYGHQARCRSGHHAGHKTKDGWPWRTA